MDVAAENRPWPAPERSWAMRMRWCDLAFLHWPVAAEPLRRALPAGLELDLFGGEAWLGVVPFRMEGVAPRGMPSVPWLSAFPELNLRTYVTAGGRPGVWFFSLDAGNPVAVRVARRTFHLPYYDAEMECGERDGWVHYASRRTHRGVAAAEFRGRYRAVGDVELARAGSLEHWLTERYCLYAADGRGRLWRGEIAHARWPLQAGEVVIESNTLAASLGIELTGSPARVQFARRLDVVAWGLDAVAERG